MLLNVVVDMDFGVKVKGREREREKRIIRITKSAISGFSFFFSVYVAKGICQHWEINYGD